MPDNRRLMNEHICASDCVYSLSMYIMGYCEQVLSGRGSAGPWSEVVSVKNSVILGCAAGG